MDGLHEQQFLRDQYMQTKASMKDYGFMQKQMDYLDLRQRGQIMGGGDMQQPNFENSPYQPKLFPVTPISKLSYGVDKLKSMYQNTLRSSKLYSPSIGSDSIGSGYSIGTGNYSGIKYGLK